MTQPKASPAFVAALRVQAERIGVDYQPGSGVVDRYTGERLDTPGDLNSFFHALDLPHIMAHHRNWEQTIAMILSGNLAAPGSKRPIYFDFEAIERKAKTTDAPFEYRRQIDFEKEQQP